MWYKTNEVPALQEKTKLARTKSEMQKAQNGEWSVSAEPCFWGPRGGHRVDTQA